MYPDALYEGLPPIFPESITRLNNVAGTRKAIIPQNIVNIGENIEGYKKKEKRSDMSIRTSDGYKWYISLEFEIDGKKMTIAIPWMTDDDPSTPGKTDRSCAVYAEEGVSEAQINKIIERITHLMDSWLVAEVVL